MGLVNGTLPMAISDRAKDVLNGSNKHVWDKQVSLPEALRDNFPFSLVDECPSEGKKCWLYMCGLCVFSPLAIIV